MRWRATLASLLLILAAIAGGAYALSSAQPAKQAVPASSGPPPVPVVAEPVKSGNVPIYLRGIGTVVAYNTVTVRTQVQGQITKIAFTEGQTVHAGDVLAQIDPRPYQAQLDQAIGNLDRDQALHANAQANLGRDTPLLAKGWVTPQAVDLDKANVGQYAGAIKADEGAIENARVQLDYTRITSPIDGVVGIRQIDIGNVVHPTDANGIVVVTQIQPISVIFTLPESDLPEIQARQAKGTLTVLAYSQQGSTELDRGTLLLVNNEINQPTGTLQLKATFPNPAERLWPGQLVDARLLIQTRHDGLTVPAPAVQRGPSGSYVYVVKPDGTVENRAVTVGQIGSKRALIDAGLQPGEKVVVDGQSKLQPGTRVTLLQGQAARAAEQEASDTAQQMVIP
jgi:multidrug efflux system membrane fusion protein